MPDPRDVEIPGRRRFLMLMALACASSTLAHPAVALAEALPAPSAAAAESTSASAAPKPPSDEARALAEVVRLRHGAHLTPAELRAVAEDLDSRLEGGRALRKLAFGNGDEPDFTFRA